MTEEKKGFGEQLYQRLQGKGLSKGQIYKVLAIQRLTEEVAELGAKGLLSEGHLLEISKIGAGARQKQVAELAVEKNLSVTWVKEIAKLIRSAEKSLTEKESSKYWDFFFEIKEMLDQEGPTKDLLKLVKNFGVEKPFTVTGMTEVSEEGRRFDDRSVVAFGKLQLELGRGLDVGTVNICSAAQKTEAGVAFNIQRNAFLDVRSDTFTKKMLMKLGIDYIVQGEKGYVIGDPAFELANIFEKNTRRPMKDGMISPVEPEALLIVSLLIAQLLGHPQEVGEVCAFSVPADPVDAERNVIYHRGALEAVLRKLGYTPKPVLEGHSVVFAELPKEDYTGIGISCGGGMFNVCVAYKSVPALTFSTSRGGDWIDQNVSTALGMPVPQVCAVKESGVDLKKPRDRVEDAVVIYYRNLIQYTLEMIKQKFETAQNMPSFTRPIEIVCAGGTSLVTGFIDVFREEFTKVNFPIEVKSIRLARDPLRAIAEGCLQAAIEETKALKEIQKSTEVMIGRAEITKETTFDEGTKRRILQQRPDTDRKEKVTISNKVEMPPGPAEPQVVPVSAHRGDTHVRHIAMRPDTERVIQAQPLPKTPEPVPMRADSEVIVKATPMPKAGAPAPQRPDTETILPARPLPPKAESEVMIRPKPSSPVARPAAESEGRRGTPPPPPKIEEPEELPLEETTEELPMEEVPSPEPEKKKPDEPEDLPLIS